MIEKVIAYKSADGKFVGEIGEVHVYEIRELMTPGMIDGETGNADDLKALNQAVNIICANRDKVIDILSTGPRSKPSARKINGGTKKRTPKPPVVKPEDVQRETKVSEDALKSHMNT